MAGINDKIIIMTKSETSVMEEVQSIRKDIKNNITARIGNWLLAISTACLIGIFGFLWQLKEDVPLLKQGYINTNNLLNNLQNSVNNIQIKQQASAENQARVEERLKTIEYKIDKQ